jgi:5-formyltetrahydrofolate cyclo-ligase
MLIKRRAITTEQYDIAGQTAKQLLITNSLFHTSQHIACYFSRENEFDCAPIIQEIWRLGKTCYLPVLSSQQNQCLEFVAYHSESVLRLNRYNIFEPESGDRLSAEKLDLVIVPLVAFDRKGHRIGMGGGYYDRAFAFKQKQYITKPYLLGLGYEFQKMTIVPNDPWDILLDGVLTEKKAYYSSRSFS